MLLPHIKLLSVHNMHPKSSDAAEALTLSLNVRQQFTPSKGMNADLLPFRTTGHNLIGKRGNDLDTAENTSQKPPSHNPDSGVQDLFYFIDNHFQRCAIFPE